MPYFRQTTPGIEFMPDKFSLPRHRHFRPYATIALAGQFLETGYVGRIRARCGDVMIHPSLDCHANRMLSNGIRIIRLDWHDSYGTPGLYCIDDPDALARAAEKDVKHATILLRETLCRQRTLTPNRKNDWPDLLATHLRENASLELTAWAEAHGLAPETVSRGFSQAYGATPKLFRAELRTRSAWLRITCSRDELSAIAVETGFYDQSHMTRWIQFITGHPPTYWRSATHSSRSTEQSATALVSKFGSAIHST